MVHGRFKYATIVILVLFVGAGAWFWSSFGNPFRKPLLEREDRMLVFLNSVSRAVLDGEWAAAQQNARAASARLKSVSPKLQLVANRLDFDTFQADLARLGAAVELRDRTEAYMLSRELVVQWKAIARP
jgi:hypothetical protein